MLTVPEILDGKRFNTPGVAGRGLATPTLPAKLLPKETGVSHMNAKEILRITESDMIRDAEAIRATWMICELLSQGKKYPDIRDALDDELGISINLSGQGDIAYLRMVATVPEDERIDCNDLSEEEIAAHANRLYQGRDRGLSWGQVGARMGVTEGPLKRLVKKHYGKSAG